MIQFICNKCGKPAMQDNATVLFSEHVKAENGLPSFSWYGVLNARPMGLSEKDRVNAHLCIECAVKYIVAGLARFGVTTNPQKHIEFHDYVWKDGHGTRIEKETKECK